ncbi:MAG: hypothetical protein KDA80_00210 [Planctomycetaceae bacterium]|nr:hypothetical protein [Planctomycetaceae bacterium]
MMFLNGCAPQSSPSVTGTSAEADAHGELTRSDGPAPNPGESPISPAAQAVENAAAENESSADTPEIPSVAARLESSNESSPPSDTTATEVVGTPAETAPLSVREKPIEQLQLVKLKGRASEHLHHQFSLPVTDSGAPGHSDLAPLPKGAAFDSATRTFSWTPTGEQADQQYQLKLSIRSGDGTLQQEQPVVISVGGNYQPPARIPAPVIPLASKSQDSVGLEPIRQLIDVVNATSSSDEEEPTFARTQQQAAAKHPDEGRIDYLEAMGQLKSGSLTVSDYDAVLASFEQADKKLRGVWLPASQYRIWALAAANREGELEDAIKRFDESLVQADLNVVPIEDIEARSYWLGKMTTLLSWSTKSEKTQEDLDRLADQLQARMAGSQQDAFAAGRNTMLSLLEADLEQIAQGNQAVANEREQEIKDREQQLAQVAEEMQKLKEEFAMVETKYQQDRAPLAEELESHQRDVQEVQNDLSNSAAEVRSVGVTMQTLEISMANARQELAIAQELKDSNRVQRAVNAIRTIGLDMNAARNEGAAAEFELKGHQNRAAQITARMAPFQRKITTLEKTFQVEQTKFKQSLDRLQKSQANLERQIAGLSRGRARERAFTPSLRKYLPIDYDRESQYVRDSFPELSQASTSERG